jgi:hypothetical protein
MTIPEGPLAIHGTDRPAFQSLVRRAVDRQ